MARRRLCGCGQHRSPGQRQSAPRRRGLAAPRKCDRVPVRVQSAWNGQGSAPNIAACTGQHSFRTRAGVQTIRSITLGSSGSGQPANTPKSNTRVHQSSSPRTSSHRANWQPAACALAWPGLQDLALAHPDLRTRDLVAEAPRRHDRSAQVDVPGLRGHAGLHGPGGVPGRLGRGDLRAAGADRVTPCGEAALGAGRAVHPVAAPTAATAAAASPDRSTVRRSGMLTGAITSRRNVLLTSRAWPACRPGKRGREVTCRPWTGRRTCRSWTETGSSTGTRRCR